MAGRPGAGGRVHCDERRVRLADVRPSGRLRLDGVARYLQDIAADDVRDAGVADEVAWVVRRTAIEVASWPRYDDVVEVATWCSGVGAAWAERRTQILRGGVPVVDAAAVWVSLDPRTMRPAPPTERFHAAYGPTGSGRRVRTRLTLPAPDDAVGPGRPWPLRGSDTDLLGHVNNAVAWEAVEDELSRGAPGTAVLGGEVEYRAPIGPAHAPTVRSARTGDRLSVWLDLGDGEGPAVSAVVRTAPRGRRPPPPRRG